MNPLSTGMNKIIRDDIYVDAVLIIDFGMSKHVRKI